ncbi:MAG: NifU family protein [Deltaproteobacteria bacterium]|nr:NifU family protein [Deltaproteobacteria bacterium]
MKEIKIQAFPQINPSVCSFLLEEPIETFGIFDFNLENAKTESEIAREIFTINGITHVTVIGNTITVTKSSDEAWSSLGKNIGTAIRTALQSGKTLISDKIKQKTTAENQLKSQVQKILSAKINPALAGHGGFIELWDVRKNDIFVKMGGGCQGCASSKATLKQGVQHALKQEIPELNDIHDATDHSAGVNPYY